MRVLVLDVWAKYAHFSRAETRSSQLTYSFPPPTAVQGLLAAIAGEPESLDKNRKKYLQYFPPEVTRIAIRILTKVEKVTIPINFVTTREWKKMKKETQILSDLITKDRPFNIIVPVEFIRQPRYRIYFATDLKRRVTRKFYNTLKERLEGHCSTFTPFLGISECIAEFEGLGERNAVQMRAGAGESVPIDSVIPGFKEEVGESRVYVPFNITQGQHFVRERVPLWWVYKKGGRRMAYEWVDCFFSADAKPLKISSGEYLRVDGENILFF